MKKSHVDVVFDRKKRVAKCGKGLAEYRLYLARGVRKYIPIAEITPSEWEHFTDSLVIQNQLAEYDKMLSAIEYLGKPVTMKTLQTYLFIPSDEKTKIRDIRVIRCEKQFSRGVIKTTFEGCYKNNELHEFSNSDVKSEE